MTQSRNFIIVPSWIMGNFLEAGNKPSDILNFAKVRQSLSAQDIAVLQLSQELVDHAWFKQSVHNEGTFHLYWTWMGSASAQDKDFLNNEISLLEKTSGVEQEIKTRLLEPIGENVPAWSTYNCIDEKPFIIYDTTVGYSLLVINPGFRKESSLKDNIAAAVTSMLTVLYAHLPLREVAKRPLFRQYLSLL